MAHGLIQEGLLVYYIGVDIGGTFTDCVLVDQNGNQTTATKERAS